MNFRTVFRVIGKILCVEGILMMIPFGVAIAYGESETYGAFTLTVAALIVCGSLLNLIKNNKKPIHVKEGFVICGLAWILMSVFGALPFIISGAIPNYIDAFFETVSGFTTTGSTILSSIEGLPKGILFWRSLTHWIGGMGVLSFLMAIVPKGDDGSMYMMRAETPGPKAGKLVAKISTSSRILYGIYIGLTLLEVIILLFGGLGLYDSVVTSISTAGTGGFSVLDASIAGYNSIYVEYVVAIFMMLFGVNFNLYYFLIIGRLSPVLRDEELKVYFGIIIASTAMIAVNIYSIYENFADCLRYSFFNVNAIMSTAGFANADFEQWPAFSKMILLLLMFFGGCAGSTAGGIKLSRVMIYFKESIHNYIQALYPRRVMHIRVSKKPVGNDVLKGVNSYFVAYMLIIFVSIFFMSIQSNELVTPATAVISCFNNVGPGMGEIIGVTGNFGSLTIFQKLVLCFDMLAGRLEIFPVVLLILPSTWKNN